MTSQGPEGTPSGSSESWHPLGIDTNIVDAHHHLYESDSRTYSTDDFRHDAAGLPLVQSVYVECGEHYYTGGPEDLRCVGETDWVAGLSVDGLISGIVGYANLCGSSVSEVLAAHVESGGGRFRGIRQGTAWDADPNIHMSHVTTRPGMLVDPAFARGVAELVKQNLVCDVYVYFHQLLEVADLARAVPEATIVLNHLGGILGVGRYAAHRREVHEVWRTYMASVAVHPNVVLKVGGLGRPLAGLGWDEMTTHVNSAKVARYWMQDVLWAIGEFGSSRCMFESNFPVDKKSFSYSTCWNSFDLITSGCSQSERQDLFHDTAVSTYRLSNRYPTPKDQPSRAHLNRARGAN